MDIKTNIVRSGYDKKSCIVHARFCEHNGVLYATAQKLDTDGVDKFEGIMLSSSRDSGKTWSDFSIQNGLQPLVDKNFITVGCDATPMHHKQTGKLLLLGHTAEYKKGSLRPEANRRRYTFYSVYDDEKEEFSEMKLLEMPEGLTNCGNGCGESIEVENGKILIPVYYTPDNASNSYAMVMKCSFDGEMLTVLETGSRHTVEIARGLCEPSITFYNGMYYMTIRNDECGLVAQSEDGLHYYNMQLWKWDDGSILQSYNTQQHWLKIDGELYLVYTRRGANNDRVFRHRAPLFAAKVENMKLVKDSEFAVTCERGARLGNFGTFSFPDGTGAVMAAEWMQPKGCEQFGSDNSVFYVTVKK